MRPAVAGERIAGSQLVRTAQGSGAVLELADGSRIELAERSELGLGRRWDGTILELERGSLIVEAAEQRRGHLYVDTGDCRVSVVGTIFSVNHGAKGSRVSVIEGEVHVQPGRASAPCSSPGSSSPPAIGSPPSRWPRRSPGAAMRRAIASASRR